jgi:hypothetical protein
MLYTGHAKYEEGRESNHHTYPLCFSINYLYVSATHYAIFIEPFSKTKANANYTNLNNASETVARSLWIQTHSTQ